MTDHKAEAERILTEPAYGFAVGNDPHGAALAHAVLALAEQQRIANQIAYLKDHPGMPQAMVREQIEQGLGLS